jgi:hypothetical protein
MRLSNCVSLFLVLTASYANRSNHGQPNLQCHYCKAVFFWYGERVVAYMEVEILYTMVAVKVKKSTFLRLDLTLNH